MLGLLALTAWHAAGAAHDAAPEGVAAPPAERVTRDEGDRYRTADGERRLLRVEGALVVTYDGTAATKERAAIRSAASDAGEDEQQIHPHAVILRAGAKAAATDRAARRAQLSASPGVRSCNPLFFDPAYQSEVAFTAEIIVRLRDGVTPASYFGADAPRARPLLLRGPEYVLTVTNASAEAVLAEVNRHAADPRVEWAEPNLLSQARRDFQPNDLLFADQWHHDHTGQNATPANGDIRTPQAWDLVQGGSGTVVIAIIDDGVQWTHPDLQPNLFVNTGDNDSDSVDDDGNGVADDASGYNFASGNNQSFPNSSNDNHGTSCAGMAAARGNNGIGVAGSAFRSLILPVKIMDSNIWISGASRAQAIRYAAGLDGAGNQVWRGADILSMSWGDTADAAGNSALSAAAASGRNGKGCVLFGSSGNSGSGYMSYVRPMTNLAAGSYFVQFEYYKDDLATGGMDTVWLAGIILPDAARTRVFFDTPNMPAGWSAGGHAPFTIEDDPRFAYGTGRYQARSGSISSNQVSWLRSPVFVLEPTNQLHFKAWVDTEAGTSPWAYPPVGDDGDWLFLRIYDVANGTWSNFAYDAGVPGNRRSSSGFAVSTNVHWPSSHSNVIGVGGCTDMGFRFHGSQYQLTGLRFVAPTAHGVEGVWTTDRTGTNGYNDAAGTNGNYTAFSGTSAACPLAAGVGALLLTANTNLTRNQVRQRMEDSCDPIGEVTYVNNTNTFYGHGRINAYRALLSNAMPVTAVASQDVVRNTRVYYAGTTQIARDGFEIVSPGDVTFRSGGAVRLQDGFHAHTGSLYRTVIDPGL